MPSDINLARSLFGPTGALYGEILAELSSLAHTEVQYTFMGLDEFQAELMASTQRANEIYWKEILQRAHLAAVSSAVRHSRWFQGALTCGRSENFLAFSSCIRGLVEACADSYDSLSTVALSLGENYGKICDALAGKLQHLLASADVEDRLMHFQFAGRHPSPELLSKFRAKTIRDYLKSLGAEESPHILDLYGRLCELTHPAEASLAWLVARPDTSTISFPGAGEIEAIRTLCANHQEAITETLSLGINSDLLLLKTVNAFPIAKLRTPYVDTIHMPDTPAWLRISQSIADAN